jgi:hypothetical protein
MTVLLHGNANNLGCLPGHAQHMRSQQTLEKQSELKKELKIMEAKNVLVIG